MTTDPNKQAFVTALRQELEKDTMEKSAKPTIETMTEVMKRPEMQKYFGGSQQAFADAKEAIEHLRELGVLNELMNINQSIMQQKQLLTATALGAEQNLASRGNGEQLVKRAMAFQNIEKLQNEAPPTRALNQIAGATNPRHKKKKEQQVEAEMKKWKKELHGK